MFLLDPRRRQRLRLAFLARARQARTAGRLDEALEELLDLLCVFPDQEDVLHDLGLTLAGMERYDEAGNVFEKLLKIRPNDADALGNRALCLARLGRHAEALTVYARAMAIEPHRPDILFNQGLSLTARKDYHAAADTFKCALAIQPDHVEILNNLGNLLFLLWRHQEAAGCFERLTALEPDYPYALGKLFYARQFSCDWRQFDETVARLRDGVMAGKKVITPFAYLMASESARDEYRNAEISSSRFPELPAIRARGEGTCRPDERIRVAYLSADFHDHATAFLMAGLFERHDRNRFEITAFSYGPDQGNIRTRLTAAFDRFLDVSQIDDAEVADRIRELGIDIAVDLKGHTTHARPGILASRPAPVQVSYLGYPGTTGLPFMDYLIADATVIPQGEEDAYSEKVVRLPESYLVNDDRREIAKAIPTRQAMALPEHGMVFCCFNNHGKLTPAVFDIWMRLLQQTPGSVLWLLDGTEAGRNNIRREAGYRGVVPERLVFAPVLNVSEHLARLQLADLFLDTWPVNAHTTACDALWGGLPVLTCTGSTFAARVATSLLKAADLRGLACATPAEYEARALELAHNPGKLTALRRDWGARRLQSRLFDTARTTRYLESAYEGMYRRRLLGLPPESFDITAEDSLH
ncbi:MAG TPA: tetratricopeptide repeat protein [Fluviicoccus sp.]|nr:tetratricopeptide repeat protein [Fluviicoccus sp.]